MDTKRYQLKDLQFKEQEEGAFHAVFATLNVVDADGDLTIPGAFGEQRVIISAYGHGSWGGELPVGKGRIYERGEDAIVEGKFFLDTQAGQETYKTVKNVAELQEWSYALPEIDYEMRETDGQRIRVLKRITVNEVSPVLMGSGVDTRLLDIKDGSKHDLKLLDHIEVVLADTKGVIERLQAVKDLRESEGKNISEATVERTGVLADAFTQAANELNRLKESSPDAIPVQQEFLRFQKILADRREKDAS